MQSVPRKIFQILDGTPAVYGQYSRGQSMVELALVTPLLIVLLMGLAEIGWFANNYLILLETTRVGARYGAIQTGDSSPLAWEKSSDLNSASLLPLLQPDAATKGTAFIHAEDMRGCPAKEHSFYPIVICPMIQAAMKPLNFMKNDPYQPASSTNGNGVDDIVVSGFALQSIDPTNTEIPSAMRAAGQIDWMYTSGAQSTQQQVLVVGRYPSNANECVYDTAADKDTRDPFNYILYTGGLSVGTRNYIVPTGADVEDNRLYYELEGYDASTTERQRGFAFTGQHMIASTRLNPAGQQCYGSEWTIKRVQQLMNVQNYSMANQSQRSAIPSQGLILVEIFWQHSLLLRNPVFNPVFNLLNDPNNPNGGGTIISVWAAFPLPTVEPRIKFALGS